MLLAEKDNTLYENELLPLSNGAGSYIYVGRNFQPENYLRRGLLKFDVAGSIPSGAFIAKAVLSLNMSRTIAGVSTVRLHRATRDWGEGPSNAGDDRGGDGTAALPGDAAWSHGVLPDDLWATPGGDFVAVGSASSEVSGLGVYEWQSAAMREDVQLWLDHSSENFGWVVVGDETRMGTSKRFGSRENPDPANRPTLVVTYSLVPPEEAWIPGDCNEDGTLDISDAICVFGVLFTGNPSRFPCGSGAPDDPGNIDLLDWQPDRVIDISDGIALLTFLFGSGPSHPLATPGEELTGCTASGRCPEMTGPCM